MNRSSLAIRLCVPAVAASGMLIATGCQATPQTFRNDPAVSAAHPRRPLSTRDSRGEPHVMPADRADDVQVANEVTASDPSHPAPHPSPLSKLFDRFAKPKRIPLPRTEPEAEDGPLAAAGATPPNLEAF